jgi:hypothetical protein
VVAAVKVRVWLAEAGGRTVRASTDEPQYLVESEESGGEAVHKASALTKRS